MRTTDSSCEVINKALTHRLCASCNTTRQEAGKETEQLRLECRELQGKVNYVKGVEQENLRLRAECRDEEVGEDTRQLKLQCLQLQAEVTK